MKNNDETGDVNFQTVYGGDSDCGYICIWCVQKLNGGELGMNNDQINCPKCMEKSL